MNPTFSLIITFRHWYDRFRSLLPTAVCAFLAVSNAEGATFEVENTNDSGAGSLRQAITDANGTAGVDEIHFGMAGEGPHTIVPETALPIITDPVVIDGYTQPASSVNTLDYGTNAVLQIELSGEKLEGRLSGLVLETSGATVRGLAINRFPEYGIVVGEFFVFGNDNNVVEGNYLGTNVEGTEAMPNGIGVHGVTGANNRLGGNDPAARNLISGNRFSGVSLNGFSGVIQGNLIGTNAAGTAALPNRDGINVSSGGGITIGGTEAGVGNVIAGNMESGIVLGASNVQGVQVQGNAIGSNFEGTLDLETQFFGVQIHSAMRNVIGGEEGGNIIAHNTSSAVRIVTVDAIRNTVRGNRIFANGWHAIQIVAPAGSENDPCDTDFGPNGAQNTAQVTSASWESGQMTLEGTLNSQPEMVYTLDFYATPTTTSGEYSQGEYYIGASEVATNADCEGSFSVSLSVPGHIPTGTVLITATATDPQGSTSTYSVPLEVTGGGGGVTDADGDGLPGDWETLYGLNDNDGAGDNGPDGDPDRDKSTNLEEYLAGTHPNDPHSVLRLLKIAREGNDLRVTWQSVGGRVNQLQASTDLRAFTNIGPEITVPGNGDVTTDSVDTNGLTNDRVKYYRVRVVQ